MRSAQLFDADRGRPNRETSSNRTDRRSNSREEPNSNVYGVEQRPGKRGSRPAAWNHDDRMASSERLVQEPQHAERASRPQMPANQRQKLWIKVTETGAREVHGEDDEADAGAVDDEETGMWQYIDPSGRTIGDYTAAKLLAWTTKGFFSGGLQVRQVGERQWSSLSDVVPKLERQAGIAKARSAAAPVSAPTPVVRNHPLPPPSPRGQAWPMPGPDPAARRRDLDAEQDAWAADASHPANALMAAEPVVRPRLDRLERGEEGPAGNRRRNRDDRQPRNAAQPTSRGRSQTKDEWGDESAEGAAWEAGAAQPKSAADANTLAEPKLPAAPQRMPASQPGRAVQPEAQQPAASKNQPVRGNAAAKPEAAAAAAAAAQQPARPAAGNIPNKNTAKRLFTAEAALGSDEPVWRYIDPQGIMQGPFPADKMVQWYNAGYLLNPALRMCGHERRVSAPNLPPPQCYKPIKELLKAVKEGHRFSPVTVAQISDMLGSPRNALASATSARSDVSAESVGPRSPPQTDTSAASVPQPPLKQPHLPTAAATAAAALPPGNAEPKQSGLNHPKTDTLTESDPHPSLTDSSAPVAAASAPALGNGQRKQAVSNPETHQSTSHEAVGPGWTSDASATVTAATAVATPAAGASNIGNAQPQQVTDGPKVPQESPLAGALAPSTAMSEPAASSQPDGSVAHELMVREAVIAHPDAAGAAAASGPSNAEPARDTSGRQLPERIGHETSTPAASAEAATGSAAATGPVSVLDAELDKLKAQAEHARGHDAAAEIEHASSSQTPEHPVSSSAASTQAWPSSASPPGASTSATQASHDSATSHAAASQPMTSSASPSGAGQLPASPEVPTGLTSAGQGASAGTDTVSAEAQQQLQQLKALGVSVLAMPDKLEGTTGPGMPSQQTHSPALPGTALSAVASAPTDAAATPAAAGHHDRSALPTTQSTVGTGIAAQEHAGAPSSPHPGKHDSIAAQLQAPSAPAVHPDMLELPADRLEEEFASASSSPMTASDVAPSPAAGIQELASPISLKLRASDNGIISLSMGST
ncbi:hypothetical protein WJX74_008642 [Apatococcus lobatus]|uniref:GYF domain-containing protein n=1 Tax=Apatococcus lobatus TaxID=904363 RepID=A0AAW1S080_9CHLO